LLIFQGQSTSPDSNYNKFTIHIGRKNMNQMPIKVSSKSFDGTNVYEGTVNIPGIKPTKLVRKADGTTRFVSRSAVLTSARSLAKRLGYTDGVMATTGRMSTSR
jgi:hypothetical protein